MNILEFNFLKKYGAIYKLFLILLILGFSSVVYELCKTKEEEKIIITENPLPYNYDAPPPYQN